MELIYIFQYVSINFIVISIILFRFDFALIILKVSNEKA